MVTISTKECAAMIRKALAQGFPNTKFSVRLARSTYSNNIEVQWTDGPTQKQVKPILDRFVSSGFDGMTDCSYSCGSRILNGVQVEVDGNYVRGSRSISNPLRKIVALKLARETGVDGVTVDERGNVKGAEQNVPFSWYPHDDKQHWTVDEFISKPYILAHDSHRGEWLSNLIYRVENNISLEEQQPIAAELLPEYIDTEATVSTGRAEEFEPRQKMFEGHAVLDGITPAIEQSPAVPQIETHCRIGRTYHATEEQLKRMVLSVHEQEIAEGVYDNWEAVPMPPLGKIHRLQ